MDAYAKFALDFQQWLFDLMANDDYTLTINGEVRQDGNSSAMLNPIVPMIQHMAGCFSLQAGDVILTGTPVGVGPLTAGDTLELELVGHSRFSTRVL